MYAFRNFRPPFLLFTLSMLSALALTSCPPPAPKGESLKVLLATGVSDAPEGTEGVLAESDILSLHVRVQSLRLLSTTGSVIVFGGPKTVDLMDLTSMAALLSSTTAPAGSYTGVELVVTQGTLIRADAPLVPIDLALADEGIYTINFPLVIAPNSSGLLYVEFGGVRVFQQEDATYLLVPEPSATLRETMANTRVEGLIERVDAATETFILAVGSATFTVDFGGADIFLPSDYAVPSGGPANLVAETRVSVTGTTGLDSTLTPHSIEILDLPDTPTNEEGERVTVCYVYGDNPVLASTIEISRSRLDFVIAQGGFEGSCEGGDPYTLTYAAGPGGAVVGETSQRVLPGADGALVTAVPEEGFAFVNWSDGGTLNPRIDTAVGANISVTANFTPLFSLTYTADAGGVLAGNTSQLVPEGGHGSPVTAVRNAGFMFNGWSDGRTDNPRTDLNVDADITVSASFIRAYTLTYTAAPGGTLEGAVRQALLEGADGTPVTAIPAEGFVFTGWSDGNTDNPRTDVDVDGDLTVRANFVAQFTLTYLAGANGELLGETTQLVNGGSAGAAVTAVGADGFGFVAWSDGRMDNPRIDANVQANVSVTATFATSVLLNYVAGPNGTLTGTVEQEIGTGGSSSPVTAVPNEGFAFNRWSDGRTDNPRVDQGVVGDLQVTAEFVPTFTLTYLAAEGGTVTGVTSQTVKEGATGTSVTAVSNPGFAFTGWSDGVLQNPRTDANVTANISVSAQFIQLFRVSYTAGPNGTVTGLLNQSVREGANGRAVTAVPNDGFGFAGWSDGSVQNPRTDTNVRADLNVTANFSSVVTVNYSAGANGALTGTTVQEVAVGDDTTPVTAVPDDGYIFNQWSDGRTDNPRSDIDIITALNVTATFFREVELVSVPAGSFPMGSSDTGDDSRFGADDESPRRDVFLDAYEIGKYEVTNNQFAEFLNFIHHPSRDLLRRANGNPWLGHNEAIWFFDTEEPRLIFAFHLREHGYEYDRATRTFYPQRLAGLPEGTFHDKGDHPVTEPTWFGGVVYSNWLSERMGLEPVYDLNTWTADFTKNGYHLPTEAQWERAAGWDGEKRWIYPIISDVLNTRDRVNFHYGAYVNPPDFDNTFFINPLGILQDAREAYTSPVGWFNGVNVSPNGNVQTVDSPSPVGCYDMAGNVVEWCHDWYSATYYGENITDNPAGPEAGERRVARGGAWGRLVNTGNQRTSRRFAFEPSFTDGMNGFRIAR